MDIGTRAVTGPLLEQVQERAVRGENWTPSQLHANLAIELAAMGKDRDRAVQKAREALKQIPRLMAASTAALPETISVLLFADHTAEPLSAANIWLQLAQKQGSEPAAVTATGLMSLLALYGGEVSEAVAFGQQAIAGTPDIWISTITCHPGALKTSSKAPSTTTPPSAGRRWKNPASPSRSSRLQAADHD